MHRPKGTIVSLEQATALPYATMRFVQHGWRVIRIEATAGSRPGDPNRYIGHRVAGPDRHAAFIAPNVGKEAIAIDLKAPEGQAVLRRLIAGLGADVFCCNVLPRTYTALGIDYDTLCQAKPDLIWAGISALGPDFPDVPGFDPVIQAMSGIMDLNGDPAGPPSLVGLPLTDLKAGDDLFSGILMALVERGKSGKGSRIDISMLRSAMSWLVATLPMVDLNAPPAVLTRAGNAHRQFVPTNVYPAADGHIYLALGGDAQWNRLASLPGFETLARPEFSTFEQRVDNRLALYTAIGSVTTGLTLAQLQVLFTGAGLPHSTINAVVEAMHLPAVSPGLTRTRIDSRDIRLPPRALPAPDQAPDYDAPPRYGADTRSLLHEVGYGESAIDALAASGVIACTLPDGSAA